MGIAWNSDDFCKMQQKANKSKGMSLDAGWQIRIECVGLTNNGKFPLQHTGRGKTNHRNLI